MRIPFPLPRFTARRFLPALALAIVVGFVVVAVLRALGIIVPGMGADDPSVLARAANDALEAVKTRQPGDRRPPSYDAVLLPLDQLLAQAKAILDSGSFNPVDDYEKIRARALPVIDIATRADETARQETSFLAKEYRFGEQKGDACQYLANALWERIQRTLPRQTGFFEERPVYPRGEMEELRRIMDDGIAAAPEDAELLYIRGVVNRAEGLFAPASRDLEAAVEFDPGLSAAWNVLGLVRISLRDFDGAEQALERARSVEALRSEETGAPPGGEYAAIVYNLASFHEGLAAYYGREYRMTPTPEGQLLTARHSAEARKYFEEFLKNEPASSPDAEEVRAKLAALP